MFRGRSSRVGYDIAAAATGVWELGFGLASHKEVHPGPSAVAWRWYDLAEFITVLVLFHLLKTCQVLLSTDF